MGKNIRSVGNILSIICILLVFTLFQSCKKFLDEKSDKTLVIPSTLEDLQALLDDVVRMNVMTNSFGESSADNYFFPVAGYNGLLPEQRSQYIWEYIDYFYPNDWGYGYAPVYSSNLCLELIEKIPITPAKLTKWNNVKGSALFFRAYYFLDLAWTFAKAYDKATAATDLGIVLRLESDFNIRSERSSVKTTYDRIIADAKEAVNYLPDFPVHVNRPSKAAALGLVARAYLSMREYDSAFKYASKCLEIKNTLMDYNADPDILGLTAKSPFKKFNKETIFYSEMTQNYSPDMGFTGRIDSTLQASFDANDLRKTAFFQASGVYWRIKGGYAQNETIFFSGIAVDEMLLTRAECYARLEKKDAAMVDYNILMLKRWKTGTYTAPTPTTAAAALELILTERRKELIFRGLRWMDIKRLNKENRNIILTRKIDNKLFNLQPNDNKYALPLPKDIIDQTGVVQN